MAKAPKKKTREEILKLSIPLFAKTGYEGVSMRDVATAAGLTPAALYYHFSDKEQLYLDTVAYAFAEVKGVLNAAIDSAVTPLAQLESVVSVTTKMLAKNKPLVRLMQWVKLDGERQRLKKLGTTAFDEFFLIIHKPISKLADGYNAFLLTGSFLGMILFPFEAMDACRYLPGYKPQNDDPAVLSKHLIRLMRHWLSGVKADHK